MWEGIKGRGAEEFCVHSVRDKEDTVFPDHLSKECSLLRGKGNDGIGFLNMIRFKYHFREIGWRLMV